MDAMSIQNHQQHADPLPMTNPPQKVLVVEFRAL
ncbi:hypothetical protein EYZ11_012425 [Aspergillus tanneri]|uniref:Uncharacterized protein n=1 Tax=Aspergillus tanneri TaxID=1220188 RepID=A0A4S3J2D6_9EURO|nr:hypothetical protein EYZ11_012425 [Aspergillus tanneri]